MRSPLPHLIVGVPLVVVIWVALAGPVMAVTVQATAHSSTDGDTRTSHRSAASLALDEACAEPTTGPFNELGPSDAALLWSRDADEGGRGPLGIYDRINRTATAASDAQRAVDYARRTDRIYQYPPPIADRWTCGAFQDLPIDDTDWNSSVYPPSATRRNAGPIRDAHATIFAITPQTVAHRGSGATRYVPPTGHVLGFVDYRVAVPSDEEDTDPPEENTTFRRVEWSYVESNVTSVALVVDGQSRQRTEETATPSFAYALADRDGERVSLGIQADVRATLRKRVVERRTVYNESTNETELRTRTSSQDVVKTITVSDSLTVVVAEVNAGDVSLANTSDPGAADRHSMAVHVDGPWAGFTVGDEAVHGWTRWNFYTASVPAWETLAVTSNNGTGTIESRARPVLVHAFPSSFGPYTETNDSGRTTQVRGVWGPERTNGSHSPANVHAEPATKPYTEVRGMLVDHRGPVSNGSATVYGLVPGQRVTLDSKQYETRQTRPSNVSATLESVNETAIELTITLRDPASQSRIDLDPGTHTRRSPVTDELDDDVRTTGVIVVQGGSVDRRYRPPDGRLSVTLPRGEYHIEFKPASWIAVEPAYTRSATTVQLSPLSTERDGQSLLVSVFVAILPMAVVYYVSHRAGVVYDTITDDPRP